jgi:hypothetical protein
MHLPMPLSLEEMQLSNSKLLQIRVIGVRVALSSSGESYGWITF